MPIRWVIFSPFEFFPVFPMLGVFASRHAQKTMKKILVEQAFCMVEEQCCVGKG